jgi:tetratricopeptide (TPR) repeat protein
MEKRTFGLFFILSFLISGYSSSLWAQFDTDTPTYSPTPKLAITGTPFISTIWLGVTSDPLSAGSKKKRSQEKEIDMTDMSNSQQSAPLPTPTPQALTGSGSGNGAGNNGNGSSGSASGGAGQAIGAGSGTADKGIGGGAGLGVGVKKGGQGVAQGNGPRMIELYKAGIENYRSKDFDQAIEYLKESLSIKDPSVPDYYYAEANAMLAVIYKFGRPDNALAHHYCNEALRIDPSTATAKKLSQEIDASDTETEAIYEKGIQAYEKGNYPNAIALLEKMVHTQDPTTPSFYYAEAAKTLGIIYQFYKKDITSARKYYQIALKIEPKDELAKKNLSQLEP